MELESDCSKPKFLGMTDTQLLISSVSCLIRPENNEVAHGNKHLVHEYYLTNIPLKNIVALDLIDNCTGLSKHNFRL